MKKKDKIRILEIKIAHLNTGLNASTDYVDKLEREVYKLKAELLLNKKNKSIFEMAKPNDIALKYSIYFESGYNYIQPPPLEKASKMFAERFNKYIKKPRNDALEEVKHLNTVVSSQAGSINRMCKRQMKNIDKINSLTEDVKKLKEELEYQSTVFISPMSGVDIKLIINK